MAYDAADSYDLPVHGNTVRLPAVVQEIHRLAYNDEVKATVEVDNEDIENITFRNFVNSSARLTIPSTIRNLLSLEDGDRISISFERTGQRWTPEVSASARKAVYESAHPEEPNLEAVTDVVADD